MKPQHDTWVFLVKNMDVFIVLTCWILLSTPHPKFERISVLSVRAQLLSHITRSSTFKIKSKPINEMWKLFVRHSGTISITHRLLPATFQYSLLCHPVPEVHIHVSYHQICHEWSREELVSGTAVSWSCETETWWHGNNRCNFNHINLWQCRR